MDVKRAQTSRLSLLPLTKLLRLAESGKASVPCSSVRLSVPLGNRRATNYIQTDLPGGSTDAASGYVSA